MKTDTLQNFVVGIRRIPVPVLSSDAAKEIVGKMCTSAALKASNVSVVVSMDLQTTSKTYVQQTYQPSVIMTLMAFQPITVSTSEASQNLIKKPLF